MLEIAKFQASWQACAKRKTFPPENTLPLQGNLVFIWPLPGNPALSFVMSLTGSLLSLGNRHSR